MILTSQRHRSFHPSPDPPTPRHDLGSVSYEPPRSLTRSARLFSRGQRRPTSHIARRSSQGVQYPPHPGRKPSLGGARLVPHRTGASVRVGDASGSGHEQRRVGDLKLFEPITMLRLSRYATAKSAVVYGLQGGRVSASACSAGPPRGDGGPTPPRRLAPSGSAVAKSEASVVPSGGSCTNSPGRPSAHSGARQVDGRNFPIGQRRAGRLLTASLLLPSQARQGSW
jgi:hypothetical protein